MDVTDLQHPPDEEFSRELFDLETVDQIELRLREIPSWYTFVYQKYAEARSRVRRAKRAVQETESEVFNEVQRANSSKTVARTEADVDEDPRVKKARERLNDAKEYRDRWKGALKALEVQKDMLVQLSSREKKEADLY